MEESSMSLTDQIDRSLLEEYKPRAERVNSELNQLFEKAMSHGTDSLDLFEMMAPSLEFLRRKRKALPYRIVLFLYASQFDPEVRRGMIDGSEPEQSPGDPSPVQVLTRKVELLDSAFFGLLSEIAARPDHYVAALMKEPDKLEIPLIWRTPEIRYEEDGNPKDVAWVHPLAFLCEISSAIVTYGGFSRGFILEKGYLDQNQHLGKRAVWMYQDLTLRRMGEEDGRIWHLSEIETLLDDLGTD